jgi:hypothetical protein
VRSGGVLPTDTMIPNVLVGVTKSIKVDELAVAMVNEVVEKEMGQGHQHMPRNRGRELLRKHK